MIDDNFGSEKKYFKELYQYAERAIFENAAGLRKNQTIAEQILWECLRNKKLKGYKFRRQHPISKYIVDFYCAEKKLAVELDGKIHNKTDVMENDKLRTNALKDTGVRVIRFKNREIISSLETVLNKLIINLEKR